MRAGRAQWDGTGCPACNLLRQGWRRGGELEDGKEKQEVERGGEEVRGRKYDGSTVRQAASSGSTMGELF